MARKNGSEVKLSVEETEQYREAAKRALRKASPGLGHVVHERAEVTGYDTRQGWVTVRILVRLPRQRDKKRQAQAS